MANSGHFGPLGIPNKWWAMIVSQSIKHLHYFIFTESSSEVPPYVLNRLTLELHHIITILALLCCYIFTTPTSSTSIVPGIKQGTDLAYFKHIFAAGNLNYSITEICCIFQLYHNS